jgi:acyl-CoA dehydrogenase
VDYLLATFGKDIKAASTGAVPFLKLMGIVAGGWQMARAALVAEKRLAEGAADKPFYEAKIASARFFADQVLSQASGLCTAVLAGGAGALGLSDEQFLAA